MARSEAHHWFGADGTGNEGDLLLTTLRGREGIWEVQVQVQVEGVGGCF